MGKGQAMHRAEFRSSWCGEGVAMKLRHFVDGAEHDFGSFVDKYFRQEGKMPVMPPDPREQVSKQAATAEQVPGGGGGAQVDESDREPEVVEMPASTEEQAKVDELTSAPNTVAAPAPVGMAAEGQAAEGEDAAFDGDGAAAV